MTKKKPRKRCGNCDHWRRCQLDWGVCPYSIKPGGVTYEVESCDRHARKVGA